MGQHGKSYDVRLYFAYASVNAKLVEYGNRDAKDYVAIDAIPEGFTPVGHQHGTLK